MANLLSRRQPDEPISAALHGVRNTLYHNAADHTDIDAYQAAITEASALVVRLRQIAAGCSRAKPLLEFAEQIEDAAFPLEAEAMDWNDGRDGRAWGDKLDARHLWRSEVV